MITGRNVLFLFLNKILLTYANRKNISKSWGGINKGDLLLPFASG